MSISSRDYLLSTHTHRNTQEGETFQEGKKKYNKDRRRLISILLQQKYLDISRQLCGRVVPRWRAIKCHTVGAIENRSSCLEIVIKHSSRQRSVCILFSPLNNFIQNLQNRKRNRGGGGNRGFPTRRLAHNGTASFESTIPSHPGQRWILPLCSARSFRLADEEGAATRSNEMKQQKKKKNNK